VGRFNLINYVCVGEGGSEIGGETERESVCVWARTGVEKESESRGNGQRKGKRKRESVCGSGQWQKLRQRNKKILCMCVGWGGARGQG